MQRILAVMADIRALCHLSPPLDAATVERLAESFIIDAAEKAAAVPDTTLAVAHPPAEREIIHRLVPGAALYIPLYGKSPGERMELLFSEFRGAPSVLLNVKSPTLPARLIELAFDALSSKEVDIVLGPTQRGWYLVGMNQPHPDLFEEMLWTAGRVPERLMTTAAELGLSWYLLPEWHEVDSPAELAHLAGELLDRSVTHPPAWHTKRLLVRLSQSGIL
ncbi:MAG: TIGR04282 family arsenosugar biosynthesis glycosyltransferase [Armatimonadota bacterium]